MNKKFLITLGLISIGISSNAAYYNKNTTLTIENNALSYPFKIHAKGQEEQTIEIPQARSSVETYMDPIRGYRHRSVTKPTKTTLTFNSTADSYDITFIPLSKGKELDKATYKVHITPKKPNGIAINYSKILKFTVKPTTRGVEVQKVAL